MAEKLKFQPFSMEKNEQPSQRKSEITLGYTTRRKIL